MKLTIKMIVAATGALLVLPIITNAAHAATGTIASTAYVDRADATKIDKIAGATGDKLTVSTTAGGVAESTVAVSDLAKTSDVTTIVNNAIDGVTTDVDGKADKAVPTAAGNIATLDATGNLVDGGKAAADLATTSDVNDAITNNNTTIQQNITNAVNGVTTDVEGKADLQTGAVAGNVTVMDANGQYVDSGTALTDVATTSSVNTIVNNAVSTATDGLATTDDVAAAIATDNARDDAAYDAAGAADTVAANAATAYAVKATEGVAANAATAAAAAQSTADTINTTLTTNDTVAKANSALQTADLGDYVKAADVTTAINTAATAEQTRADTAYAVKATEGVAADAQSTANATAATVGNTTMTTTAQTVTGAVNELNTATQAAKAAADAAATAADSALTKDEADAAYATVAQGAKADATDSALTTNDTIAKANAALPTPPADCSDPANACALTMTSTGLAWEVIAR